jgi:hypothetical protein
VPHFTIRHPAIVVSQLSADQTAGQAVLRVFMVVELASPHSERETLVDKRAHYAAAGIPLFLIVLMDGKHAITEIQELHLDAASATYRLHAVHRSILDLEHPVRVTLPISSL